MNQAVKVNTPSPKAYGFYKATASKSASLRGTDDEKVFNASNNLCEEGSGKTALN